MSPAERRQTKAKEIVKARTTKLDVMRKRVLKLRVGGANGAGGAKSAGQRQRMENVTNMLEEQDDQLGDATRTLAETEEIAASILDNLGSQTQQIRETHDKVKAVQADVSTAASITERMSKWWRNL